MAYVNVKDWSVDQVMDWLKGLDNVLLQYHASFLNNGVTGHQLLNLRADDLEHLGVKALGHQEIILEAVEHLRNFHFELDKENLQMLALRLSCAANSLFKELLLIDDACDTVNTQVMSDVHNIISTIKPLVLWLERSPFTQDKDYIENKRELLNLGFVMATCAHRGVFSENPVRTIREICEKLSRIADHIIQDICDPMILQPASLDLATLKKREHELGFYILPTHHPIHQIGEIKFGSPAHGSTKIEEGDEIVQVNYQTVVGWQSKKVMILLQDSPPEIVLTLKKRPRHSKVYGQIYMKPYRLPSRKRGDNWSKWTENLPSPRLLPILDLPPIKITKSEEDLETQDVGVELSSSDSEPPDSPLDVNCRMYPLKPRPILQRRNTITGTTPTSKRPYASIDQYWDFIKSRTSTNHAVSTYNIDDKNFESNSMFLRDKSASCNVGLDLSPRPTTVGLGIGLAQSYRKNSLKKSFKESGTEKESRSAKKKVNFDEKSKSNDEKKSEKENSMGNPHLTVNTNLNEEKSLSINSLSSLSESNIDFIDEGRELTDRTSMACQRDLPEPETAASKPAANEKVRDPILSEINVHNIIKKFDDSQKNLAPKQPQVKPKVLPRNHPKKPPDVPEKPDKRPAVPPRSATTKLRGKLDKSHSTPAYDLTDEEPTHMENAPVTPKPLLLEKLPDVVPKILESVETSSANKDKDYSPFKEAILESSHPIEMCNIAVIEKIKASDSFLPVDEPKSDAKHNQVVEVPPKPPPRILPDTPKPVYPVDSPKPQGFAKKSFDFQDNQSEISRTMSTQSVDSNDYLVPVHASKKQEIPSKVPIRVERNHFEPKVASTPMAKTKMDFSEFDCIGFKSSPNYDIQKSSSETKVSPTNSIVKAMISGRTRSGKKKNNLIAKRRKVTVNDLSPADIQGYLYQRLRGKHNQNVHWEQRWFVLLGNCLYGFTNKEDPRAAFLIFLSGFTVAVASEVKSRSNAFKVYHTGTVFYFSAEDGDSLQMWLDLIRAACLHNDSKNHDGSLYSETDDSDSEKPKASNNEKTDSLKKFGSLKKFASKKSPGDSGHGGGSTSLDRKWFFNKSSNNQPKNNLPVPTAQFRSYRKMRAAEPVSVRTGNFTSHVPLFAPGNLAQSQNVSVPNLTVETFGKCGTESAKVKQKTGNYVHASNPSLCNVSEYSVATSSTGKGGSKTGHENFEGFVTLEELMNRQTEERKLNPHHVLEEMHMNLNLIKPDVVYGEVPIRPKEKASDKADDLNMSAASPLTRSSSASEKHESSSSCFGKRLGSLKKNQKVDNNETKTATFPKGTKVFDFKSNRSLPREHRMQETGRECEEYTVFHLHYTSDKNLSLGKKSYEMIYCPETVNDVQFAQNRMLDDIMCNETPKKGSKVKRQRSIPSYDKKSSNRIGDSSAGRVKLKSAVQYTPMSLPLSHDSKTKPKFAFELNLDEKQHSKGGKLKQMFGGKHEKKEKTFLGSPKLHGVIFKKQPSGGDAGWSSTSSSVQTTPLCKNNLPLENSPQVAVPFPLSIRPHADYPGLEYPPVFEAETYSLADPQSSLNLIRKQKKDNENVGGAGK
ncbi:uncharacterized protein LOC132696152 [Cylas formicarius]|uniref:uncharacterized protein LOC132696152 n=1 Tax=Cylas formicarius TaxID=197179 RepID=UPI002958349E|nr:uncharacterized protein LOC132696152 [Cylas formicarius]XP_060516789.1 uncharacterized protein LOC132696152 [Cylas formicarius]